jgi:hypothetical protein
MAITRGLTVDDHFRADYPFIKRGMVKSLQHEGKDDKSL